MATLTRSSNLELLNMPECKWLQESGKCSYLKIFVCRGAGCSFYQRENSSLAKTYERLRSLDEEAQERISQKYYGGFRPWTETDTKMSGEKSK